MVYKVKEHELHKSVRQRIITTKPELLHKLTSKKFAEAMIFLQGILVCLTIMAEDPIRKQDTDEFILVELVKFVLDEKSTG